MSKPQAREVWQVRNKTETRKMWVALNKKFLEYRQKGLNVDQARRRAWDETFGREVRTVTEEMPEQPKPETPAWLNADVDKDGNAEVFRIG